MIKKTWIVLFFGLIGLKSHADEGLWVPMMLEKYTLDEMEAEGFKLTAEDIYDINQASLKDAVVGLGDEDSPFFHFCTAELISDEGLLLTNYHCAYDRVQQHTTLGNNYLKGGFWAKNRASELCNPGLTASVLVRMEDVTESIASATAGLSGEERQMRVVSVADSLEASVGSPLQAKVLSYFNGNQYLMSVYKIYRDVRLVGVPQESVGKFGGDTDNWTFPRHTGDFALLRIYADKRNEPADISMANVPYRPAKSLEISLKGVQEGDFTMVMGYPGRTDIYCPSFAISERGRVLPYKIQVRDAKLDILKRAMAADESVRLQYTAKAASVSNAWKKWQGELKGLDEHYVLARKEAFELVFSEWAAADSTCADLLDLYVNIYQKRSDYVFALECCDEALYRASEIVPFAQSILKYSNGLASKRELKYYVQDFYKDYDIEIDCEILSKTLSLYFRFPIKDTLRCAADSSLSVDMLLKNSVFASSKQLLRALLKRKAVFENDSLVQWTVALMVYKQSLQKRLAAYDRELAELNRRYVAAQIRMQPRRAFYPDANSTMRMSYGMVSGFAGGWRTYLSEMLDKGRMGIYDYVVSADLAAAFAAKDFGGYGEGDDLPLCFTANNHTSGGNSGSPVLNGEGQLVGINFDRAWQGVMSDYYYDVSVCRNIALDIRFVLFYIEKIAGASYLLDEMQYCR